MYDVVIAGGGPAGATLARLISKKYKVLLLEKRDYSAGGSGAQEKCCGGLVDPDAQMMLAKFRLGIPKEVLLSPQLFAVRVIDIHNSIERYYQRHYINIDRRMYDKWLLSIIPDDCDVRTGCVFKSFESQGECIQVKYIQSGEEQITETRLLIGADGAHSSVRMQGFKDSPAPDVYVSIQEWYETGDIQNFYGAIFDEEITDFYSWTIPKENQLILGSAIREKDNANEKFELLKKKLSKYGFDFSKCTKRNGAYLLRPRMLKQLCPGNERIALVGEAGGFISPSSAEGLSYAFKSSLALAKALGSGFEGYEKRYRKNLSPLYKNIAFKNLKSPGMYSPFIRNAVMRTGLLGIDIE